MTKLFAPSGYWGLTEQAKKEICNGCGSSQSKFDFVPDNILGLNINEACNIHDYMYYIGVTIEDKKKADRALLNNLLRIIDLESCWLLKRPRRFIAYGYYDAVKKFGGPAYWNNKNNLNEEGIV